MSNKKIKGHVNYKTHCKILVSIIQQYGKLSILELYRLLTSNEGRIIAEQLDLTKHITNKRIGDNAKVRIRVLLKVLLKEGKIRKVIDKNSNLYYEIEPEIEKSENLTIIEQKEGPISESWIAWTNPEFNGPENRWEFSQINEKGEVLEVYHHEDEEELKQMHKSKVSEHLIASMQNKIKESKSRYKQAKEETKKKQTNKSHPNRSSIFISEDIKLEIMDLKLKGNNVRTIIEDLSKKHNLSYMSISIYVTEVLDYIRKKSKDIIGEVLEVHLERYEELYRWFKENNYSKAALKALDRKERLFGLENDETNVNNLINNVLGDKIGVVVRYDYSRLSEEEYLRLRELVQKTLLMRPPKTKENDLLDNK